MHILKLTSENVKRLKAVEITPDGNAIVIGGANEQGKTSVLDSVMMVLAGTGSHPPRPVRSGEKEARITVDLGDEKGVELTVKKKITRKGAVTLVVEGPDGEAKASPQKVLDALCGAISFDPSEFARMKGPKQMETLRGLCPSLDFAEMDERRASVYSERTVTGRQAKEASAVASDLSFFPNAAPEAVDVAGLTVELERRIDVNATNNDRRKVCNELQEEIEDLEGAVKGAEARLVEAQAALTNSQSSVKEARDEYEEQLELVKALEDLNVGEIREQIASAKDVNDQIEANAKRKEANDRSHDLTESVDKMTAEIEDIDEKKRKAIEAAQFPIDGLGFDEDGVLFNGVPFEQASQSERWRASIAIGIAMNPELRVMLVREGALLDDDRMKMVAAMAKDADVQIWIEDVGDGRASVVIEDGSIKS